MKSIMSKIYPIFIVREWIECGEFNNTDKIIVIGSKFYALAINLLLWGSKKKIYYCVEFTGEYKYKNNTKWIILDNSLKRRFPQNSYNVLIIPDLNL